MLSRRSATPAKLLTLFVLLSGVPLLALGWLAWRVLQQDRTLEAQRQHERLDNAAALIARELDRTLTAWEEALSAAARDQSIALPPGAVFLLIDSDGGVLQRQGLPLPYYPRVAQTSAARPPVFAAAEALEFRDQNMTAATAAYRELASSADESIRAEALMRLARCLRKQHRIGDALAVYARLAAAGGVPIAGSPAELVARRERIILLQGMPDSDAFAREQTLLTAALVDGRYPIDRATFDFFSELVARDAPRSPDARIATRAAAAVTALSPAWLEQPAGRTTWSSDEGTFASVWRRTPRGTAAIAVPLDAATTGIRDTLRSLQVTAQLDDGAGRPVWGRVPEGARLTKSARETGLPWSLHVAAETPLTSSVADSRRNLFAAGFALMALVVSAASYVVFRAVNRELRVARLQSDFVAAVSHEFRTPLTAMCHLTEMLEHGEASGDRLPEYYRALGKESRRLHAMVENLLDFGRMDSGRRAYAFDDTDAVDLVNRVAQEFADRVPAAAHRIERSLPAMGIVVRADREALALALRNLLDNAMKYSPASSPVRLAVLPHNGTVAVSVEDRGAGIGPEERREIFRKFTRGAAARTLNVKGTGIGLTMADQIVKAHGGRLELISEPGRGSTFTIVLPAAAS